MKVRNLLKLIPLLLLFITDSNQLIANEQNRLGESLCEAAEKNDTRTIRKKLKTYDLRMRDLYNRVICGKAGSLLRVATRADSMKVAKFIIKKVKKKALLEPERDGKNILEWTENFVANDASKQSFLDLFNSKT